MTTYLWTMVVLLSLEMFGKICWLATGEFPERRPGIVALDVIGCIVLLIWAVWLLK